MYVFINNTVFHIILLNFIIMKTVRIEKNNNLHHINQLLRCFNQNKFIVKISSLNLI